MCGENLIYAVRTCSNIGSPPRVRGKPTVVGSVPAVAGITPACAGKTYKIEGASGVQKDHPRVCGENHSRKLIYLKFQGSPPRVRGKLFCMTEVGVPMRITPACAGKTYYK